MSQKEKSELLKEKLDYAFKVSEPYRFHEVGCLLPKSVYFATVVKEIENNPEISHEEIEQLIKDNAADPEVFQRRKDYSHLKYSFKVTETVTKQYHYDFEYDPDFFDKIKEFEKTYKELTGDYPSDEIIWKHMVKTYRWSGGSTGVEKDRKVTFDEIYFVNTAQIMQFDIFMPMMRKHDIPKHKKICAQY